ncbi:MAG TPA: class IV adenylate cyclase [Tepidisphaeraceae bacterium]|jgi:adenylate cyclase class 2|nr:class IV adenylate cyclase [Tepidisphaeraceae bacterium]
MAVEIEAKMKVENLEPVREKLREVGGKRLKKVLEDNTFFDKDDRSLLASDEGLRLRKSRNDETGEILIMITHKGPRQRGMLKSRHEVEVPVGEWESAIELFEKLGFGVVLSFEKRRETWALDRCKVELDEVPYLGTFIEIEGPAEADVLRVRSLLGMGERGIVKASYAALLGDYVQERGLGIKIVKFEA